MGTLLLVRHCSTEASVEARYIGRASDPPLTRDGQAQAQVLAAFLYERHPTSIFVSPLRRARQTSAMLEKVAKKKATVLEELAEMDYGAWEGLTEEQIKARDPDLFLDWRNRPHDVGPPGGETVTQVAERAKKVLATIREADANGVSVAFGHKTLNRALLSLLTDIPLADYRRSVPQPVGCINIIEWTDSDAPVVRGVGLTGQFG